MTLATGASGAVRGEATPPPFAVATCRRGEDGSILVDHAEPGFGNLLTIEPAEYIRSDVGSRLALAIDDLHSRTSAGGNHLAVDLRIEDPSDRGRALHCRAHGLLDGFGDAVVMLVLHDLTPQLEALRIQMRHAEELLRLLRLSEILLEHPPAREGLIRIVDEIATAPGLRTVAIGLLNEAGTHVSFDAHRGLPGRLRHTPFEQPLEPGPCTEAIRHGVIKFEESDPRGIVEIHVPISADGDELGVLSMHADSSVSRDRWGEEILGSYADYVAAFVANAPARPRALIAEAGEPDAVDVSRLLTERQQQVLFLLVDAGAANRTIAAQLGTSEATVKVHMRAIFDRLGIASRAEALHLVYRAAPGWLVAQRTLRDQP